MGWSTGTETNGPNDVEEMSSYRGGGVTASRALPDVRPGRHYEAEDWRTDGNGLAAFLGWFSIGLGVAQVAAPGGGARHIGFRDDERNRSGMRAVGLREIASGVGILSGTRQSPWLWSRVAGDAMDLGMLARNLQHDGEERGRTTAAAAAVLGVAALDFVCAQQLTRNERTARDRDARAGRPLPRTRAARPHPALVRTKQSITVVRQPAEVYAFWRDFENLPRFMRHLERVERLDGVRSRWTAKGPAGTSVSWDAEIVQDVPNEMIAWRSLEGADVPNAGTVRFVAAPGGRGTEVRVEMEYTPPAGRLGATVATLFREEPRQQVHDDLHRFKQVMEVGEVVLSDASAVRSMHPAQPLAPDESVTTRS